MLNITGKNPHQHIHTVDITQKERDKTPKY